MFLVSAVKTQFLNIIFHGEGIVVHLLLLKFPVILCLLDYLLVLFNLIFIEAGYVKSVHFGLFVTSI